MPIPLIMSVSNTTGKNSVASMPISCIQSMSNKCFHLASLWMISDCLSKSNITKDILSLSNTYTNVATLPVS